MVRDSDDGDPIRQSCPGSNHPGYSSYGDQCLGVLIRQAPVFYAFDKHGIAIYRSGSPDESVQYMIAFANR